MNAGKRMMQKGVVFLVVCEFTLMRGGDTHRRTDREKVETECERRVVLISLSIESEISDE